MKQSTSIDKWAANRATGRSPKRRAGTFGIKALAKWLTSDSYQPYTLFIMTLSILGLSEFLIMMFVPQLDEYPKIVRAFIDASFLAMISAPFLFGLFFKPLKTNIEVRIQTEIEHDRIREMDRLRGEFISIAGHELRTPLAVIRGYAELLLMEKMFDENRRAEFASIINGKTVAMERLIDDLMDVNRLQSGHPLSIARSRNDMVATVRATVDDYRREHPERTFPLHLPVAPALFEFDQVRIAQVLDNLLSNAIKFSAAETPVEIEGLLQNGAFRVRVRDRGIGMTREQQAQVFDKFYRADTTDTSASGLGLGMAIVKEIIDGHGGQIGVESAVGAGTTVTFSLPV